MKRSPEALNNPYYKIVPKLERRNMWGSSEFGSFEEGQDNFWKDFNIDGDYGMKSPSKPRYSQNVFNKYNGNNRRQRNMKVGRMSCSCVRSDLGSDTHENVFFWFYILTNI